MKQLKIEHQAGSDIINELASQLYKSPNEAFREIISNAIDEGSETVIIKLSAKKIVFEDYGNGIQDPNKFAIYGQSSKFDNSRELVGQKGIGKLSVLMLREDKSDGGVLFLTNNGKTGMHILMNRKGFEVKIDKADEFLEHQGTQVVIPNPTYVPTQDELIRFVSKTFGLWIKKGLKIIINDDKVRPFKEIDVEEEKILKGITGNIKEDQKGVGTIDVYVKHVYVTSALIDPNHLFSGWVNCNWITPVTARDDIVKDKDYRRFISILKDFVRRFPEKEPKTFTNEEKVLVTEINKLTETFMEENNLKVIGKGGRKTKEVEQMVEVSVGDSTMMVKKKEVSEADDDEDDESEKSEKSNNDPESSQKLNDRPIKHLSTNKFGVLNVNQQYGEEKPPIFFFPPNVIVLNTNSSLYSFVMRPNSNLGPQYVRVLPYFARALADLVASIKGDYEGLTARELLEKRDLSTDKILKFFLKLKRVMRPSIEKQIDVMEQKLENKQKEPEERVQQTKIIRYEDQIKSKNEKQKTQAPEIIIQQHKKRK